MIEIGYVALGLGVCSEIGFKASGFCFAQLAFPKNNRQAMHVSFFANAFFFILGSVLWALSAAGTIGCFGCTTFIILALNVNPVVKAISMVAAMALTIFYLFLK